jgi:hypothetical protein
MTGVIDAPWGRAGPFTASLRTLVIKDELANFCRAKQIGAYFRLALAAFLG